MGHISKSQLEKYLVQLGVIAVDSKNAIVPAGKKQIWVDDDDFLDKAGAAEPQDSLVVFSGAEDDLAEQISPRH